MRKWEYEYTWMWNWGCKVDASVKLYIFRYDL